MWAPHVTTQSFCYSLRACSNHESDNGITMAHCLQSWEASRCLDRQSLDVYAFDRNHDPHDLSLTFPFRLSINRMLVHFVSTFHDYSSLGIKSKRDPTYQSLFIFALYLWSNHTLRICESFKFLPP